MTATTTIPLSIGQTIDFDTIKHALASLGRDAGIAAAAMTAAGSDELALNLTDQIGQLAAIGRQLDTLRVDYRAQMRLATDREETLAAE